MPRSNKALLLSLGQFFPSSASPRHYNPKPFPRPSPLYAPPSLFESTWHFPFHPRISISLFCPHVHIKTRQQASETMRLLTTTLASLLASALTVVAHNIQLHPHSRECFHETLHKDDRMTVTFQVGDREFGGAGNLDVDFWVRFPPPLFFLLCGTF